MSDYTIPAAAAGNAVTGSAGYGSAGYGEFAAGEFRARRRRFAALMNARHPGWGAAVFLETVNQYYFTGTMQYGVLFVINSPALPEPRLVYGVRRSFPRARMESPLFRPETAGSGITGNGVPGEELIPFNSYGDLKEKCGGISGDVYVEGDTMPLQVLERLKKYFPAFSAPRFLDTAIRTVRAVKSEAELALIRASGAAHRALLEEKVPLLLREGVSEAEFLGALMAEMYRAGWQGINRFHQREAEIIAGQCGFGENSLYPSRFDGPGGAKGHGPASPLGADGGRRLKKGDAVFVDTGFGIAGYHSDKTQVYFFGAAPPAEFAAAQRFCVEIQKRAADLLRPGNVPSKIYETILASLDAAAGTFMGVDAAHRVKFIGHGVGLAIDEFPVIAKGFDEPLEAGMVIALEPKKAVPGTALAGVEDTYIVTEYGGECVTGGGRDIIRV